MADETPAWRVTGQSQTTKQLPNGVFADGWNVEFQTRSGHYGSVFVPNTQYTADLVRAAINEKAAAMESIAQLQG